MFLLGCLSQGGFFIYYPILMTGTDQIGSQSVENTDKVEDIEVLKKNYADSTREAVFLAEANKVLKDNTYLAKVAKNDRKLAEKISQDTW